MLVVYHLYKVITSPDVRKYYMHYKTNTNLIFKNDEMPKL